MILLVVVNMVILVLILAIVLDILTFKGFTEIKAIIARYNKAQ